MPLNLSREDRRLLSVATILFAASALLAVILSPVGADAPFATSYSTASQGAKAAYLLLQESGYHVERWDQSPAALSDPRNALLILIDPNTQPTQADKEALDKFLSDGGVVMLAGALSPLFVSEKGPTEMPMSLGWRDFQPQAPSRQARNAPEIKLDADVSWNKPGTGIGLYGDDSHAVVMQYAHGSGRVLWLASSSLLSNAGLPESSNLEFLLSTVGTKSRHILWDEYFHGHRTDNTKSTHPQLAWLFGQLTFVAAAVLLTFSRRSGPQRAPVIEPRHSPLEYVRALGHLYEHAGAANVAVDIACERFRYSATKRVGVRPSASSKELADAIAARWHIDREDLRSLLDACESARFFEDLSPREALALVRRLHKYSVLLRFFPETVQEIR